MSREPLAKLEYTKGEDGMLYPNLQISMNKKYDLRPTGMFGRRWKDYMMSKYPQRLSELIALGQINELIYGLDIQSIAADDCILFLWVTFPCLEQGLETIRRWGFTYKTLGFCWVKRCRKNGSGGLASGQGQTRSCA